MAFNEITKSTVTVLEGKIVCVRQDCVVLSDGSESMREVVEHPGGVCIAAVDKDRNIYLVEQFRYPMGETVLELPAGKLEKGENPDHAAVRELREETGLVSENLRRVGVLYPTPGYCSEKLYLYLAENLTEGPQQLDTGELLSCFKRPLADVVPLVLDNTIRDAKTALLILLTDRLLTSQGAPL